MDTQNNLKKIVFQSSDSLTEIRRSDPSLVAGSESHDKKDGEGMYKKSEVRLGIKKPLKLRKILFLFLLIFLIFFCIFFVFALSFYKKGLDLEKSVRNIRGAFENKNLTQLKAELSQANSKVEGLEKSFRLFSFLKITPFLGSYVEDLGHAINAGRAGIEASLIFIDAIEPYANIIGFTTSQGQKLGGQTAQDRLDFVIQTIPSILPKADELITKVSLVRDEIGEIDYDDYPIEIGGKKIRENIRKVVELFDSSATFVENSKPLLEAIPYLMGVDKERKYLVLFQNDKELRPTGGFITAYSVANVLRGRFDPVVSDDIYNLDNAYKPKIRAAEPVIKYLQGPYVLNKNFRLRDMNWSPDFEESMKLFLQEARSVGIKDIDGVIAVDTQLLVYLLEVIGPVNVPGYGNFSTKEVPECKCPQVIYELESFADIEGPIVWSENEPGKIVFAPPNYDNRKKIIGPLMNSILSATLGQPEEKFPQLFEVALKSLTEKHVLFYVNYDKAQKALADFGIAGKIRDFDQDYLHINDANLGGRKSNLYVIQEVEQVVEVDKNGSLIKTLVVTYKNPEKHDGWLNSVLPNWVRIYVPKGSELIETSGFEDQEDPYQEFGKTVFSGFFKLRPQGVAKISLKYKLPFTISKNYSLLIQKQPGTKSILYNLKLGKKQQEFYLNSDKEINISI